MSDGLTPDQAQQRYNETVVLLRLARVKLREASEEVDHYLKLRDYYMAICRAAPDTEKACTS